MDFFASTILFSLVTLVFVCISRLAYSEPFFSPSTSLARRLVFFAGSAALFGLTLPLLAPLVVSPLTAGLGLALGFVSPRQIDTAVRFFSYAALCLGVVALVSRLITDCVRAIDLRFSLTFGLSVTFAFVLTMLVHIR